ncbi:lactococcin 972 family bacteriocin [Haloactinospora alba]|uniref:lactococcin 972 family bacteriocin n=1 Tax=Haloactinospora alba TaxID=405555 RepID=UPI001B8751E7|nr:lactococcin 972 family bacteriocin [Haloactinospora alba]
MKKKNLRKVVLAGAIAFSLAPAGAALADTDYVGGGTWEHGTTGGSGGGTVYSNYHHSSEAHGSSVKNCDGVVDRSPTVSPGSWSNAQANAIKNCADQAYWRKP